MKPETKTQTHAQTSPSEDWRSAFEADLRADVRSERTVQAYLSDVRSFVSWFEDHYRMDFTPDSITSIDLRAWRAWVLENRAMKPATFNRRRISLMAFCDWLVRTGVHEQSVFEGVDIWEEVETPSRWLEPSEQQRLMRQVELHVNGAASKNAKWRALRNQAAISLMLYACLRVGEVAALDAADIEINPRSGSVRVQTGKGEKFRTIPLNIEARRSIGAWIDHARPEKALFPGGKWGESERSSERTFQREVTRLGAEAGIEISAHDLRHTGAKRMADAGVPLTVIQKILGHADLRTTARYIKPGWSDFEDAVNHI